jgi:hypothetical protein
MPGGSVHVEVGPDFELTLQGPAQIVYEAVIRAEVLAAWSQAGSTPTVPAPVRIDRP